MPGLTSLPTPILRALVKTAARAKGIRVRYEGDSTIRASSGDRHLVVQAAHLPYMRNVISNFDVYWNSVADVDGVADFSKPALHRYRDSGLAFWLPSIPEEASAVEAYFLWGPPERGAVIFDIGAHAGVATYHLAAAIGPTGRVYAFEPDPLNFELLERNIALHGMTNVVPVRAAIAGTSGRRRFNFDGAIGSAFSNLVDRGALVASGEVDCLSLPDACAEVGAEPSFVKLDAELAEVEIIRGAIGFLRERDITVVTDTGHNVLTGWRALFQFESTATALAAAFREAGYDVETRVHDGTVTTWASHRR